MSNQCRNCGRDVNNNYVPYTTSYSTNKNNTRNDASSSLTSSSSMTTTSIPVTTATSANASSTVANQITAKVMFGTIGALNELREKEQIERNSAARAGRRQ